VLTGTFIVLAQTCDLEHEKVTEVLLADVIHYDVLYEKAGNFKRTEFRKALIQGVVPAYCLLMSRDDDEPVLPWSVVDFHHLRLINKAACCAHAERSGPRLRLRSPYKEHLAQSYARYMMRVALPNTTHEFEKYKPEPAF